MATAGVTLPKGFTPPPSRAPGASSMGPMQSRAQPPRGAAPTSAPPSGGVGVTFAPNGEGVHIITALRPGGAAESCGRIVVNDILWGINNQVVKGMTVQQVIGMLTGAPGSEVTLMVLDGKFPYLSPKYCQLKRQTTAVSMGTHKK